MDNVKIYISSRSESREVLQPIMQGLRDSGYTVVDLRKDLNPSLPIKESIYDEIKSCDVIIVIFGKSEERQFHRSEDSLIKTVIDADKSKLLVPVILDSSSVPEDYKNFTSMYAKSDDLGDLVDRLRYLIDKFYVKKKEDLKKKEELQARIENNSANYISEALENIKNKEIEEKRLATNWQSIGFVSIVCSIVFSTYSLYSTSELAKIDTIPIATIIIVSFKGVFSIALFIAAAKYAFDLGKSHMDEALKYSDRMHAISFGKFYLQVFGDTASWEEIKSVFENWNISNESSFSKLQSANFDPEIIKSLAELIKALPNNRPNN